MKFKATKNYKRLDHAIADQLPALSRSFISALCDQGKVALNTKTIYKTSAKVNEQDLITIDYDFEQKPEIENIKLDIVYQDPDCLAIIKPEGLLTHSKGRFNPEATVSSFIRQFTKGMEDHRGGIVHRLDRITSGLLICAKNEQAHSWLQKQFAERKVTKTYVAVVTGQPKENSALIDMPIERNPKKPQTFRVGPNGKPSKTKYKVLASNDKYSLVELQPETGRTHQLRVHLAQIGHPILGDEIYGGEPADRTYLHAEQLEIVLPNKKRKHFEAPTPKSFYAKVD